MRFNFAPRYQYPVIEPSNFAACINCPPKWMADTPRLHPDQPAETRGYLTAEGLAAAAKVSLSTVWRYKRVGKIPVYQPGGAHHFVRFPLQAIEFLRERQEEINREVVPKRNQNVTAPTEDPTSQLKHLSGPRPKWMS